MTNKKKLRVGWFSFSCCEDSTIIFTELLNDHYMQWKNYIEFAYFLPLPKKTSFQDIDLSFIEGAVTSEEHEKMVKKIRDCSQKVVAIGACAVSGMPSGQRNTFDEKTQKEIAPILLRFTYASMVKKIADVIRIDAVVPGCPMDENIFLKVINTYLSEFGIIKTG